MTTGGNGEAALPTERGATAATLQRQREVGGQQLSPHPPASHAWLANRSPHTASGQRKEATASANASGHENGERDRGPIAAIGHSDHPGAHAKAAAVTGSGNSRNRSRQSDLGGAASGQKTATVHTETARANTMRPLAVQRPPTTSQGKTANETIHAHSVTTLNRARKAKRQREQQDRSREPSDQERA